MYTCVKTSVCCIYFAGLTSFLDGRQAAATGGRDVYWWQRGRRASVRHVLRVRRQWSATTDGWCARDCTGHPSTRHHVRGPPQGSQRSWLVGLVGGRRVCWYVYQSLIMIKLGLGFLCIVIFSLCFFNSSVFEKMCCNFCDVV